MFSPQRFIALHETLIARIDRVIDESKASREAMDSARTSFEASSPGRRVGLLIAVALLLPILSGCRGVPEAWQEADRATYQAIAPEYLRYIGADPALSEDARQLRRVTVETWRIRTETAAKDD